MIFGVFPGLDGAFGAKLRASHHRCFSNKHTAVIDILSLSSKETNLCSVCEEMKIGSTTRMIKGLVGYMISLKTRLK